MPGKVFFFIIIFLTGFMELSAQVPGFYMKEEGRKKELPFINSNNLIIIPVSINNGPPVNFLLDTGVKTNILFSKTFGDFLNLNYTRKLDLVGADGQTVLTASVSPTNELDMGEVKGVFQTLLVLDEDFLELERVIGIPVFGVIGYEFFKYNPVKINYDEGIITFYKMDAMKWGPLGFKKIPIKMENSKPYLHAKIKLSSENELIAKLLIDTGANHGLLLNRETSDQIVLPENHLETDLGRSLGGDLYGFVGRVKSFNLNSFKFNNVITSFPNETEFSYVIKDSGRQGSLGSEILGRMNIIYDYQRERIFVRRNLTFYEPFEFDMSGIVPRVIPSDELRIYVSQVRKDSPAFDAGVRDGDEFVSINGIPLDFWELSDLIKIFRSEEGREIKLIMKRYSDEKLEDFELNTFTFKLKRQI
ncbi:Periplasmic protease [Aquiflexum balticum DSM 16537]|uniref:Periplasmic protease n=2 Tax=Aquiflexum TaxID=280472 RepID=A0A1W2H1Y4_9BACT|nr:aspartyl protease family protein [Aquiflexum balticum]SMD42496.1 Periplasmic protease [Aquiflexum balticum DSM 16537]